MCGRTGLAAAGLAGPALPARSLERIVLAAKEAEILGMEMPRGGRELNQQRQEGEPRAEFPPALAYRLCPAASCAHSLPRPRSIMLLYNIVQGLTGATLPLKAAAANG